MPDYYELTCVSVIVLCYIDFFKVFKFCGHNELFLLGMGNKLDIEKYLVCSLVMGSIFPSFFHPIYFHCELKTLHIENSTLAVKLFT